MVVRPPLTTRRWVRALILAAAFAAEQCDRIVGRVRQ